MTALVKLRKRLEAHRALKCCTSLNPCWDRIVLVDDLHRAMKETAR